VRVICDCSIVVDIIPPVEDKVKKQRRAKVDKKAEGGKGGLLQFAVKRPGQSFTLILRELTFAFYTAQIQY